MELIEERRKILLNTPHIETISTSAFKTDMIAPFKKLEARFKATQSGSGDPSPDNIRPIEGKTELIIRHSGVNIWDEEWELGSLNNSTGEKVSSSSSIRAKNFIPVRPNTQYYFPNLDGYVLQYDQNKEYIGILSNRNTKPTDATCYYLKFRLSTNYGTVYKNDYSINYPATYTEYEPYIEPYYPLGKNLANPDTIIKGGYYNGSGTWSANTVSATTGLIRVKPNTTYVSSIFDNAGTRLNACVATLWNDATTCTGQITTQKFTTGSQTQYVRIRNFDAQGSYITNDDFKFQLEEAEAPTAFEEYKGVGYIVNWGKNLFDQSLMKDQSAWNIIKIYAPVGTNLIMSTNQPPSSESGLMTYFMYNGGQQGSNENCYINHPVTRIVPEIGYVQVAQRNRDNISSVEDWNYQVEIGSQATEYQPYVGEVYGGTVDLVSGAMTIDRAGIVLTESLNWGSYNLIPAGDRYRTYVTVTGKISETAGTYKPLCDKLTPAASSYPPAYGVSINSVGNLLVCMPTTIATKQDFLAWIAEQRPFVVYPIAEPYTIQLTPQQILTLKNNNTLMPEGSINELKYWTHI